jgi:hypothetical protein
VATVVLITSPPYFFVNVADRVGAVFAGTFPSGSMLRCSYFCALRKRNFAPTQTLIQHVHR